MSKSVINCLICLFLLTSHSSVRLYDGITSTRLYHHALCCTNKFNRLTGRTPNIQQFQCQILPLGMILSCCHPCSIFIINFPKIHFNDMFKSHSSVLKWMLTKYHPTQLVYIFVISNLTTYPAHCNAVMILEYS